jgi:hypothetical protein
MTPNIAAHSQDNYSLQAGTLVQNSVTRFGFYGIGESSVRKNMSIEMGKAIGRALKSAK